MKRTTARAAGALFLIVLQSAAATAAATLSESQARNKAIAILQGDPYGTTAAQVLDNIKAIQLISAGTSNCSGGRVKSPVWELHVIVAKEKRTNGEGAIDGWMSLDARTGKMLCAGLPFLD